MSESRGELRHECQQLATWREAQQVCVNVFAAMGSNHLRRSGPDVVESSDSASSPRVASPVAKAQKFNIELLASPLVLLFQTVRFVGYLLGVYLFGVLSL